MLKTPQNAAVLALAACLVIGFAAEVRLASHRQDDRSQNTQNHQRRPERGPNGPATVQINCDPNCTADNPEDNGKWTIARFIRRSFNDPLTIVTLLLVLVVLSQVRDGRRSAERQLRAYLMLESAKFGRPKVPDGDEMHWYIHAVFKNFGKTPAYDVVFKIERKLEDNPPIDISLPLSPAATVTAPMVIAPRHIHTLRLGGFDNGHAAWLEAGRLKKSCFLWGRVDYADTFGLRHFTKFQMVCTFGQIHQFGYCQNGNGTDDRFRRFRDWWRTPQIIRPTLGTEDEHPVK